jgi:hypothetical protein
MTATTATRELTTQQQAACKGIFRQYQTETGREPDAWRRMGQAFAEMCKAVCVEPDTIARWGFLSPADTEDSRLWNDSAVPSVRAVDTLAAYFGLTRLEIIDFEYEPVAVPRKGLAGIAMRLLMRFSFVTLLGIGHRLHVVRAETLQRRLFPLATDTLTLFGLYSGLPRAVKRHTEAKVKRVITA